MMELALSIRQRLAEAGAVAVGFAKAGPVDTDDHQAYTQWLSQGLNAGMDYLHNYPDLRFDPSALLSGARSVISLAFSYVPEKWRDTALPMIASFAYGKDYHNVLRKRLKKVVRDLETVTGAQFRICIDSAPVRERYWALRSGVGFRGRNGLVIVPGVGSFVFLAEIVTTLELLPDAPLQTDCGGCGACLKACPTGALQPDGYLDCRKCLSWLTIELPHAARAVGSDPASLPDLSAHTLFGCDRCQISCPHNRRLSPGLPEFQPSPFILSLDAGSFRSLTDDDPRIAGSPIRRAFH